MIFGIFKKNYEQIHGLKKPQIVNIKKLLCNGFVTDQIIHSNCGFISIYECFL